jgi:hypothetical protein
VEADLNLAITHTRGSKGHLQPEPGAGIMLMLSLLG